MAHRFHTDQRVRASAERTLELMIDPRGQEQLLRSLGTPEVEAELTYPRDGVAHVVIHTAEPAMKGAGTHRATLEMDWELATRTCRWVRHDHSFGERVQASGVTRIVEEGEHCRVVDEGSIEVKVPVIGRAIAKKVVSLMEEMAPRKAAWWSARLKG
jgi:hypothetical protein